MTTKQPTPVPVSAPSPQRKLRYHRLHPEAPLPFSAYERSAAYDLSAFLLSESGRPNTLLIPPRTSRLVPTGLVLLPPPGFFLMVCSRSGLATKSIFVSNAPGIIDPDYTGEIKVILFNGSHESFYVKHGDRIAQVVVTPFNQCGFEELKELPSTQRGDKGFGSTGS